MKTKETLKIELDATTKNFLLEHQEDSAEAANKGWFANKGWHCNAKAANKGWYAQKAK